MKMPNGISVIGTGSYMPPTVVLNNYFDRYGSSDEWIYSHLGIKERRYAAATGLATSDLAAEACRQAIENAGLSCSDIDLVIVATITPDRATPSTACKVLHQLDIHDCPAFDISAACAGFIYSTFIAQQFILAGNCMNALLIGADTMFSTLANKHSRDGVYWGDGAGAIVLSRVGKDSGGFIHTNISACGDAIDEVTVIGGCSEHPVSQEVVDDKSHYITMDGRAVFRSAIQIIPLIVKQVLKEAGMTLSDIHHVIPHQPAKKMIVQALESAEVPLEKTYFNMDKYANTSSATIPITLDEVHRAGKLMAGDNILFATIGAGWVWGASILKWSMN